MLTDSQKLLCSAHLVKEAKPAWVSMLEKGLLSPKSVGRLAGTPLTPKGTIGLATRQLNNIKGKPTYVGGGGEGSVYKSFTSGHGPSVMKRFAQKPNISTGGRVDKMQNLFSTSDVYPQFLGALGKTKANPNAAVGYAIPELTHNPKARLIDRLKSFVGRGPLDKGGWAGFVGKLKELSLPETAGTFNMTAAKKGPAWANAGLPNAAYVKYPGGNFAHIGDMTGSGNIMYDPKTLAPKLVDPMFMGIAKPKF